MSTGMASAVQQRRPRPPAVPFELIWSGGAQEQKLRKRGARPSTGSGGHPRFFLAARGKVVGGWATGQAWWRASSAVAYPQRFALGWSSYEGSHNRCHHASVDCVVGMAPRADADRGPFRRGADCYPPPCVRRWCPRGSLLPIQFTRWFPRRIPRRTAELICCRSVCRRACGAIHRCSAVLRAN